MPHYAPGKYRGKIIGQRFGETKNGTPYLALEFEPTSCTSDEYAFPESVYSREITLFMSDKAFPYSVEKLRGLGWRGTRMADLDPLTPDFTDLAGTEIECACTISDAGYEDWDPSGGERKPKESQAGIADNLDRMHGKDLIASIQGETKTPLQGGDYPEAAPPTQAEVNAEVDAAGGKEEIPF